MSDTTNPQGRSAAEIEADVERTRARVTETVDALRGSMSPGQIMDQAVEYARGSGGADFMRNLGNSVRDNPLPVLLIGSGIGWLLLAGQKRNNYADYSDRSFVALPAPPASRGGGLADQASDLAKGLGTTASDAAQTVGDSLRSAVSGVKDAIGSASGSAASTASAVGDRVSSAGGAARAYRHDAVDAAAEGLDVAKHKLGRAGSQVQDNWSRTTAEQPLLIGALGLAVGAALGALLPRTQAEDRLMGKASDAVTGQISGLAKEQYAEVKDSVSAQVQDVKDAVQEGTKGAQEKINQDGISAASTRDAVTGMVASVTGAASNAAHDVAEKSKNSLGRVDSGADAKPSP